MKASRSVERFSRRWQTSWEKHGDQLHRTRQRPTGRNIHLLRTSTRRLLAVLDLVCAVDSTPKTRATRRKLRRLIAVTGAARDARVQLKLFATLAPTTSAKGANQVQRHLRKRARRLEQALGKLLKPYEYSLRSTGLDLPWALRSEATFERVAAAEIRKAQDRIRRRCGALQTGVTGAYHRVRVALKRYRYLLEALPEMSDLNRADLAQLQIAQKKMGALHDYDLWLHRLETFSVRHGTAHNWLRQRRPQLNARQRRLQNQQPALASLLPAVKINPLHVAPAVGAEISIRPIQSPHRSSCRRPRAARTRSNRAGHARVISAKSEP